MRITFLNPFVSNRGGTRVMATYARHLSEQGYDVTVMSQPARPVPLRKKLKALLRGHGWNSKVKQPTPLLDFLGDRHIVLDSIRPITAGDVPDADVVIATWWETAEWAAALPPEKGRGYYLIQDYEVFPYLPAERVIATYDLPLQKMAVSSYIIDKINETHGPKDIALLPNAVDTGLFHAPPRTRNAQLTVGFLFSRAPRKNTQLALDALAAARRKQPDMKVVILCGSPPRPEDNLPDWADIRIDPPQQALADVYADCDLWLLTSIEEGFGLPLLEAMACRTPVLTTTAGAARDLVDGTNGVIAATDTEAFTAEILRFAQMSEDVWQGYSQAASDTAQRHQWPDATKRLLAYLEKPA